MILFMSF